MNIGEVAALKVTRIRHEGGKVLGRPRREDVLEIPPGTSVGPEIGVLNRYLQATHGLPANSREGTRASSRKEPT
jgi:hypothetical protein